MCLVSPCFTGSRAILITLILSEQRGVGVVAGTPKFSSSHLSYVISAVRAAMARNLASTLERKTVVCLVFQAIKEDPRKTQ
jgi:hypothetical protein